MINKGEVKKGRKKTKGKEPQRIAKFN